MMTRQKLAQVLARAELFKLALGVHGHIIECGVRGGEGLMTWANLSATFEPYNHTRRVVGFDTFAGFPKGGLTEADLAGGHPAAVAGGMADGDLHALQEEILRYDSDRPIGHVPRVELVVGDARETIPEYARKHDHLVVALLHLDFDVEEPTRVALEIFASRMPKGAVIVFDELCNERWPGETVAVSEVLGIQNLRIRRFPWASTVSWAVIE